MRVFAFTFIILFSSYLYLFSDTLQRKVCFKDYCLEAEVVNSRPQIQQGLMFRESIADNQGMLFVFEKEGSYSFWMKNMNFALDIIWIDANKRIVDMKEDAQPCKESCQSLASVAGAKYVLEVNSGFVKRNKVKTGEQLNF